MNFSFSSIAITHLWPEDQSEENIVIGSGEIDDSFNDIEEAPPNKLCHLEEPRDKRCDEDEHSQASAVTLTDASALSPSQLRLKDTYRRAKRERQQEQEQAKLESVRLQEILDICMEFQRQEEEKCQSDMKNSASNCSSLSSTSSASSTSAALTPLSSLKTEKSGNTVDQQSSSEEISSLSGHSGESTKKVSQHQQQQHQQQQQQQQYIEKQACASLCKQVSSSDEHIPTKNSTSGFVSEASLSVKSSCSGHVIQQKAPTIASNSNVSICFCCSFFEDNIKKWKSN